MNKTKKIIIPSLLLSSFIFFQLCYILADNKVNITFIYEKIEEIIDTRNMTSSELTAKQQEMEREGYTLKYSSTDGYAYKMKNTVVSTEEELLEAMGGRPEIFLKYGQKCLLAAFRTAQSEKIQLKAEGFDDRENLQIELVDTSNDGNFFGKGYDTSTSGLEPNIQEDFWPCSYSDEPKIRLSDVEAKYYKPGISISKSGIRINTNSGKDDLKSTVYHEYAHFLDSALLYGENPYGLDGVHYLNEVTNESSAFLEGWAEYNEMIESKKRANNYKKATKSLSIESDTEAGVYSEIYPKESDFSTLVKSEIFNAYLLYKLSQEIGEAKITETFIDLNSNTYKDLKLFVKRLVELHPEDTATICKTVDEVFYFKASDEEFYEMVGNTEATQDYAGKRSIAKAKFENILKYRYEQLKNAITEKAKIINKFGKKLAKSLKSDNKESTEKCSGLFTNFINNVKAGISKGVEVTRNHVDPIFDKIKDFFNKGNTIEDITNKSSSEDDNKTNNSVDCSSENLEESDNSSETIKKEFIPSSSNDEQDQGSPDDPFSILR